MISYPEIAALVFVGFCLGSIAPFVFLYVVEIQAQREDRPVLDPIEPRTVRVIPNGDISGDNVDEIHDAIL